MDLLIALSHVFGYLCLALALVLPTFRRTGTALLLLPLLLTGAAAFTGGGTRALTTVHTYAGYAGSDMEVSMVAFPTGTFEAPGWQWPLPFIAFNLLWALVLLGLRRRELRNPWVLPLLFAWSGVALWLGMQVLAAPSAVVQSVGIDRVLWPAGLCFALVASRRARSLLGLLVMVGAGVMLARLPAALFSKVASDAHLGTVLDVHTIRDIVNPMNQMQFSPRLAEGSGAQQFWLIWLEHVIFFPAVYLMSLFGIAFGAFMFHRHGSEAAHSQTRAAKTT